MLDIQLAYVQTLGTALVFNVLTSDLMNISPYHLIERSSDSDVCPEHLAQRSRHCVAPAEQVTDVVAGSHAAALGLQLMQI